MKYVGSKNRHAKDILPIILKNHKKNQWYVEPFVGGFNIIDKVPGKRIAVDTHKYLIALFIAIRDGWEPPNEISEDLYKDIRKNQDNYSPELVGFVGFGCSYAGKWFGGYARGNDNKGNPRNYALESKKNILKQKELISNIVIINADYKEECYLPASRCTIYCDPPYENTTKYKDKFCHITFWDWVRKKSENHDVFVSEYSAPPDFKCIWEKTVNNTLEKNTGKKQGVERLFIYDRL